METKNSDHQMDDTNTNGEEEMEIMDSTTTTATATATTIEEDDYDFPFRKLPAEVLTKIIDQIPVAQWPSLEILDKNFQFLVDTAWTQLRCVNVNRELLTPPDVVMQYYRSSRQERSRSQNHAERSPFFTDLKSILQKLVERSPKLSSLSGVDIHLVQDASLILDMMLHSLANFEHLRSITLGDIGRHWANFKEGIQLETVVEFLKATRSRASLKELRISNVIQSLGDRATILDQFDMSFVNGREIQLPLKLEKFSISSPDKSLFIRLDHMDSTRLTDVRLRDISIDPDELTILIVRAPNLRWIELSFLHCDADCDGPRLQANIELLLALASLENLTAMKLGIRGRREIGDPCLNLESEFIEMLKTIGGRGQLRKLALWSSFGLWPTLVMDEVCATICEYLPYLQSIKLWRGISNRSIENIVSLEALEEIDLQYESSTAVLKASQLPHLKRLAWFRPDPISLKYLADATALTDLRLWNIDLTISGDVFDKWSDGFASNLKTLMVGHLVEEEYLIVTSDFVEGLGRLLQKAVRLRVLILTGVVASYYPIANSCPDLEILGVGALSIRRWLDRPAYRHLASIFDSYWDEIVRHLQEIVNRCPRLKRIGGIGDDMRNALQLPKNRVIGDVDTDFVKYDFDDNEYD